MLPIIHSSAPANFASISSRAASVIFANITSGTVNAWPAGRAFRAVATSVGHGVGTFTA